MQFIFRSDEVHSGFDIEISVDNEVVYYDTIKIASRLDIVGYSQKNYIGPKLIRIKSNILNIDITERHLFFKDSYYELYLINGYYPQFRITRRLIIG